MTSMDRVGLTEIVVETSDSPGLVCMHNPTAQSDNHQSIMNLNHSLARYLKIIRREIPSFPSTQKRYRGKATIKFEDFPADRQSLTMETPKGLVVRCENALFDIIFYRKTIICQDRLGTRVERKRCKKNGVSAGDCCGRFRRQHGKAVSTLCDTMKSSHQLTCTIIIKHVFYLASLRPS